MECIELDSVMGEKGFIEAFKLREESNVEEALPVLDDDWRVVFDGAFAWWVGVTAFLSDKK